MKYHLLNPHILVRFIFILLGAVFLSSCKAHVPPYGEIPAPAHARWRESKKYFKPNGEISLNSKIELRKYVRGVVLALTAHYRLPPSPDRKKIVYSILEKQKLTFLQHLMDKKRVKRKSYHTKSDVFILSASRRWTLLNKITIGKRSLNLIKNGGTQKDFQSLLNYFLESPFDDPIAPRIAQKAIKNNIKFKLSMKQWTKLLSTTLINLGEKRVAQLIPLLINSVSKPEWLQITKKLGTNSPLLYKNWLKEVDFKTITIESTRRSWPAPALLLRKKFNILPGKKISHLGVMLLTGGRETLNKKFSNLLLEAERLRIMGNPREAIALLSKNPLPQTSKGRKKAALLAMQFKDLKAAEKHLRWAMAYSTTDKEKSNHISLYRFVSRLLGNDEMIWLTREWKFHNKEITKELIERLQIPALISLLPADSPLRKHLLNSLSCFCSTASKPISFMKYWTLLTPEATIRAQLRELKKTKCPYNILPLISEKKRIFKKSNLSVSNFWELDLLELLKTNSSSSKWIELILKMGKSPWVVPVVELISRLFPNSEKHLIIAAEGYVAHGKIEMAQRLFEKVEAISNNPISIKKRSIEIFLKYGLRRNGAMVISSVLSWKNSWQDSNEAYRWDLRLSNYMELLRFYIDAGFTSKANTLVKKLIKHGARKSLWRKNIVSTILVDFLKKDTEIADKIDLLHNPLLSLKLAIRQKNRVKFMEIFNNLNYLFPYTIGTAGPICINNGPLSYCREVSAMGPSGDFSLNNNILNNLGILSNDKSLSGKRVTNEEIFIQSLKRVYGVFKNEFKYLRLLTNSKPKMSKSLTR
jgi:hypothetical protein